MQKVFIVFISLMLLSTLTSCMDESQLLKDYNGEILMLWHGVDGENYQACNAIYTPKNNKFLYINKNKGINNVSFSGNKDKILGLDGNFSIIEYDLKSNSFIVVYEGDEKKEASYDYIKYVPKSDCISFMTYPNLYIFNRKTKEKILVTEADGEYTWSKDGKKLFYSKTGESQVYCLNMESKKSTLYIDNGYDPQLSPSNDYIAYKKEDRRLAIREIKTGKEWLYKSPLEIYYYKFSPDDKQLAIMELTPKNKTFNKISLTGWDYRSGKKVSLIKEIPGETYSNFDWR